MNNLTFSRRNSCKMNILPLRISIIIMWKFPIAPLYSMAPTKKLQSIDMTLTVNATLVQQNRYYCKCMFMLLNTNHRSLCRVY